MNIQIPNAQNIFDVDVGKLLSHVVADIGIGVAITDARCEDHPVIYCNLAFELLIDLDADAILGEQHPFILPEGIDDEARVQLIDGLRFGSGHSMRLQHRRRDEIVVWIAVKLQTLRNQDGAVTHHVWLHRDVGQEVAHEELWNRFESIVNTSGECMALI